jgi:hypothetical protein
VSAFGRRTAEALAADDPESAALHAFRAGIAYERSVTLRAGGTVAAVRRQAGTRKGGSSPKRRASTAEKHEYLTQRWRELQAQHPHEKRESIDKRVAADPEVLRTYPQTTARAVRTARTKHTS